jgi:nitroreductase
MTALPGFSIPFADMELLDALRTTGAVREFTDEPVDDDALARILDAARFAPSGGNRQGWRVVVVKDADTRRQLRDLYLPAWYEYLGQRMAGMTPWAPLNDRDAEARAIAQASTYAEQGARSPGFAEHLDAVPALIVVLADLRALAAVDRDFERYTFAGGASVYPFVWSVLLAAREEGLAGVITTMTIRDEPAMRRLLHVPDELAVAAVVALGHPVRQPRRLTREPVEAFATVDRSDGRPFSPSQPADRRPSP